MTSYKRTIELTVIGDISQVRRATFDENTRRSHLDEAIGYLALWGLNSETARDDHLSLTVSSTDNEITACYQKEKDQNARAFLMVGVWRADDKKYTFHS